MHRAAFNRVSAVVVLGVVLIVLALVATSAAAVPIASSARPTATAPVAGAVAAPPRAPVGARGPGRSPDAALTLSEAGATPAAVSLSWTNPGGLFENYTVAVSTAGASGPFVVVGVVTSESTTSLAVGSLSPGASYWWQVTEYVYLGATSTSNVLLVVQPTVAYLWSSAVTSTSVQLNWNDNATYGGLLSFGSFSVLERAGAGAFALVYSTTTATVRSTTISGLTAGGSYAFYLNTTDCLGCGATGSTTTTTPSNTLTVGTVLALSASVDVDRSAIDVGQPDLAECTPSGGQSPFAYAWSINGSAYAAGNSTLGLQFAVPGPETVGCRVTDSLASEATGAAAIAVSPDPTVVPSLNRTAVDAGQSIAFNCTASGGTGTVTLSWTFGDGSSQIGGTATHAYASAGTFVAGCTGVDGAGVTVTADTVVTVDPPLTATATVSASAAAPGTSLDFRALPANGSGSYPSIVWNFGHGTTQTGASVVYAFPSAGTESVSVTIVDSHGASATASVSVAVAPIAIRLLADPTSATGGSSVAFRANATGGAGGYNYTWTFGDGTVGYGANVTHSYAGGATYAPRLTVTDRLGATNQTVLPSIAVATPPGPLAGVPLWLLLVLGAVVGAVLAGVVFARSRSAENERLSALSRWVPPVGPKGAVHGAKVCPRCGASNASLRRTCQVCGTTLPRNPDR
ncbi:MAG TPA: PKD domain-containing protein [Thermoplasmata archaeon]|nr:PKD domain-containing protein [Thermoplasmata archaeon]